MSGGERANSGAVAVESEPRKPLYSRPVMRRRGLMFQSRIVLLTLAGGPGFLIYCVLWVVMPENPVRFGKLKNDQF